MEVPGWAGKWHPWTQPNSETQEWSTFIDKCVGHHRYYWDWVHFVRWPLIGLSYHRQMVDDDKCGAVGGMTIGKGNRSIQRKASPAPLWPSQIPHDLTWAQIRTARVGSRWLITWVMARPLDIIDVFGLILLKGLGSLVPRLFKVLYKLKCLFSIN
jgi:hypothetical protein